MLLIHSEDEEDMGTEGEGGLPWWGMLAVAALVVGLLVAAGTLGCLPRDDLDELTKAMR